ncbi:MAG: glycosyltransferase family 39 protein [Bdellovibrionota bacterium]
MSKPTTSHNGLFLSTPLRIFLLAFALSVVFFVGRLTALGLLSGPPGDRDEVYFDIIAINLAAGNGFSGETTSAVKDVYSPLDPGILDAMSWTEQVGGNDRTTFRPPLYPFLLSVTYRVFGHSFAAMRVMNCLLLALGSAILFTALGSATGAGVLALIIVLSFDPHLFAFSRFGLSEALAFPLTAAAIAIPFFTHRGRSAQALALGGIFGLLLLARPVFLFWMPGACMAIALGSWRPSDLSTPLRRVILMLACVFVFYLPWGIRNSALLSGLHPFGSQGGIAFGEVYYGRSDVSHWDGNWTAENADNFHRSLPAGGSGLEREHRAMDLGMKVFRDWVESHRSDIPRLWALRAYSLWWSDAMPYQRALALIAALSFLAFARKEPRFWTSVFYLACHTLAICFAYNARGDDGLYGRFLTSVYPIFFLSIALAADAVQRKARPREKTNVFEKTNPGTSTIESAK